MIFDMFPTPPLRRRRPVSGLTDEERLQRDWDAITRDWQRVDRDFARKITMVQFDDLEDVAANRRSSEEVADLLTFEVELRRGPSLLEAIWRWCLR